MRLDPRSLATLHAVVAVVPLGLWTLFHVWEQWAAFRGREAWLARMEQTSSGLVIVLEVVAIIVPITLWALLVIRALVRREALPGAASEDDRGWVRVVGRLGPVGSVLALVFVVVHVGQLWVPKLAGASPVHAWSALTHEVGHPGMLALYAVGLSAVAFHFAAAIPAALYALDWFRTDETRRSVMIVSSVFGACVWILTVQLAGWLATGHGTFWPIVAVPIP